MKRIMAALAALVIVGVFAGGCSKPKAEQPVKLSPEVAMQKRQESADLIQKGEIKKAEEILTQVKSSIPDDSETHFLFAVTAYNKKDYETAIKEYNEAIRLNPKHFEAYNSLGNLYRDQKKYTEAEAAYRKAIELRPQFAYPYTNLALMLEGHDNEKAIQVLLDAIKIFPGDMDMRFTLASVYQTAGKKDEAKKTLEAILKDAPGYAAAADALAKLNK